MHYAIFVRVTDISTGNFADGRLALQPVNSSREQATSYLDTFMGDIAAGRIECIRLVDAAGALALLTAELYRKCLVTAWISPVDSSPVYDN